MSTRNISKIDHILGGVNYALSTIFTQPQGTGRTNPAEEHSEITLNDKERRLAAGLMRVNHAGEVAAQALYQGQAASARLSVVREKMHQAAEEENDHLRWCQGRLQELDSHTSKLNPLWYAGSFAMGAIAGAVGDKWSLGFVGETERQVVRHLEEHLQKWPEADQKSKAILEQMKIDEKHHGAVALESGGAELPGPIKALMGLTSKIMTRTAYWI